MPSLPQLRVRTGYSFKQAYGRFPEIIECLTELGCKAAAIVDNGTWGHVRYEQAAAKAEIAPMFGMEVPIVALDANKEPEPWRPRAWILAEDTKQFYQATSKVVQDTGLYAFEFSDLTGVIKFPGGAIEKLFEDEYDYVDINPSSFSQAATSLRIAREYDKPVVITSYNDMPHQKHTSFAYSWEVRDSVGMRWIASDEELWNVLRHVMTREEFDAAVRNTYEVAERLEGIKLAKAPMIRADGDLAALAREGQQSRLARGHIAEWTTDYEDRLTTELEIIKGKDFEAYFLVVSDLIRYAKRHMLVGPARGSSAGSLVCYLLDITEVDPLVHHLLFHRFIDITRTDLPDIDIDFSDTKRHLVFEYLQNKYGRWNAVRVGNINTLKAASVLAQVGKKFNISYHETAQVRNSIIDYSSGDERYGKGLSDTFVTTEPGKAFKDQYPVAAGCMGDIELHPSHSSVHAAGILVCNDEITKYCTVNEDGIAQIDKPDAEYLNLLKIDALGLRTLGIIEDTGVITSDELYSLRYDDQKVLDVINDDKISGIFQFEGDAVRSVARAVRIDHFSKIDHLTALARPGPLASGMATKYIARANGREEVTYDPPELEPYLNNTYGVFLYQEQIMYVVTRIGLFNWKQASEIRRAMSKSKGEEFFDKMRGIFVEGATSQGMPEPVAVKVWQEMVTFGAWGFNQSHSLSYAIVTYWTCWLKAYHMLEYAAACLRAAKDNEQTIMILRELRREGVSYIAMDPERSDVNWKVVDGQLIGGIQNVKGYGAIKAAQYIAKRDAGTLTDKDREKLRTSEVLFMDLSEAHTKFAAYYNDPVLAGVESDMPITEMGHCKDYDECIVIAKLVNKILSDENEPVRVKKRGGKRYPEPSQFLDLMMVDDSVDIPMRFRIRPEKFERYARDIAENAASGTWYLVKAWKISGIDMFIVKKIKALVEPVTIIEEVSDGTV